MGGFLRMSVSLRSLASIVRHPVLPETKANLARAWSRLPEWLRTPQQMYGRHAEGCGATIGAMPRCDFACTGCYLGEEANHVPALTVEQVKEQMRLMRRHLGFKGNLQLTDGEVTLRPVEEIVELIRYANEIGLIPMLMTHGDTFRRQPGMLERLVAEGGLMEVSIHVDTTQRGRKGSDYKYAQTEEELNPLRDEFAEMLREVRRKTGKKIAAATTMTVDPNNLAGVPAIMQWLLRNADVFKMISFQPMAQVGRTLDGLGGGVSVEKLWEKIAEGTGDDPKELLRGQMWLGHSACNKYIPGYVVRQEGAAPRFLPARMAGDPIDEKVGEKFWSRMGGVTFRNDGPWQAIARAAGMFAQTLDIAAQYAGPYFERLLHRFDPQHPFRFLARVLRGKARVNGLLVVSHHFMSEWEIDTEVGKERLGLCVFHVPIGDQLVSMCEVNTTGIRDAYYEDIRAGRTPGSTPPERLIQLRKPVSTQSLPPMIDEQSESALRASPTGERATDEPSRRPAPRPMHAHG